MKLKELFLSVAAHNQTVEIYFNQKNRDPVFGFKINDIDSEVLLENNDTLWSLIESEINGAFLASDLIDEGEGDTSYFLQPDLSCVKSAEYFSSVEETEQFWIQSNETGFHFENIDFPIYSILITKKLDSFKIDEEKKLKKILKKEQYEEFASFYKEILNEFQEMQIELEVEEGDENGVNCSILSMYGSYRENMDFTLLDFSEVDISKDELKIMLSKYFRIDALLADQILNTKQT